jgi:hypothetical protein
MLMPLLLLLLLLLAPLQDIQALSLGPKTTASLHEILNTGRV